MNASGRSPNACAARDGVPNRLVDERKARALDPREQQRRAAGRDDAAVDLGDLEAGIDRGIDDHEVAIAANPTQETAKVGMRRGHA